MSLLEKCECGCGAMKFSSPQDPDANAGTISSGMGIIAFGNVLGDVAMNIAVLDSLATELNSRVMKHYSKAGKASASVPAFQSLNKTVDKIHDARGYLYRTFDSLRQAGVDLTVFELHHKPLAIHVGGVDLPDDQIPEHDLEDLFYIKVREHAGDICSSDVWDSPEEADDFTSKVMDRTITVEDLKDLVMSNEAREAVEGVDPAADTPEVADVRNLASTAPGASHETNGQNDVDATMKQIEGMIDQIRKALPGVEIKAFRVG